MITGCGIDIVEIERISRAVSRHGDRFAQRLLSAIELETIGVVTVERLAGRFAAKEAVLKALGTGLSGLSWHELEIYPDSWGAPQVRLLGRAAVLAQERNIKRIHLSISHSHSYAVAQAIAED